MERANDTCPLLTLALDHEGLKGDKATSKYLYI